MDRTSLDRISLDLGASGLNLKQLYYFHAVATEGSIVQAAKKLGVAQPTISEHIRNLEEYLEASLFERRPGGLRLNSGGRRVYEHTKVMFRATRRLIQDINPKRAQDRWVLEIGLCSTVSRTFAAERFLPLFMIQEIAPRIRQGAYDDLLEDLLRGELDLLLSENTPTASDKKRLGMRTLAESPIVAIAAPEMAKEIKEFPHDLGKLPLMQYSQSSRYRWEIDTFLFDRGIAPEILAEADDVVLLASAVEKGLCWAAVPETVVRDSLQAGTLVKLGELESVRAVIFAQFQQTNAPDLVLKAIDALGSKENGPEAS